MYTGKTIASFGEITEAMNKCLQRLEKIAASNEQAS
jgi:hypothetical protein